MEKYGKTAVIPGMEPAEHYKLNLERSYKNRGKESLKEDVVSGSM